MAALPPLWPPHFCCACCRDHPPHICPFKPGVFQSPGTPLCRRPLRTAPCLWWGDRQGRWVSPVLPSQQAPLGSSLTVSGVRVCAGFLLALWDGAAWSSLGSGLHLPGITPQCLAHSSAQRGLPMGGESGQPRRGLRLEETLLLWVCALFWLCGAGQVS